jgi:hypothetical protein
MRLLRRSARSTALAEWLGTCDEVWIPLFVLAEIKAGFYGGTQRHRNEILLHKLLVKPTVDVLLPGRETAEQIRPALCSAQTRRQSVPIPIFG